MTFIHDIIKIKYIREGYLPDYPPHLISDEEMCDAFLKYPEGDPSSVKIITGDGAYLVTRQHDYIVIDETEGGEADDAWYKFMRSTDIMWFKDKYPLVEPTMESQYRALVECIVTKLNEFKASLDDDRKLPDWVYSYMLGDVLSVHSGLYDLHDMFVALGVDNVDDEFTPAAQIACYETSANWLKKVPYSKSTQRPPGLFGEPHVLKSLRLEST